MSLKVLIVGCFDSFLRAGNEYGDILARQGATTEHALIRAPLKELSERQRGQLGINPKIKAVSINQLVSVKRLMSFDVILLGLDGSRTRKFMVRFFEQFRSEARRPLTVSFYPGLLFRYHLEGMTSRMSCDIFLLNSPLDSQLYRGALQALSVQEDNSLCVGLSVIPEQKLSNHQGKAISFLGQPTVPARRTERSFVVHQLFDLAERYPQVPVRLKPRHRIGEKTLHRTRYHYEMLVQQIGKARSIPSNFSLSYGTMQEELQESAVCLTVSSTAALESIASGVPTRIVTDFGLNENLGNHYFVGSGLFADFSAINPCLSESVNDEWAAKNIRSSHHNRDVIIERIRSLLSQQDALGQQLPAPHQRFLGRSKACSQAIFNDTGLSGVADYADAKTKYGRFWRKLGRRLSVSKKGLGRTAQ